VPAPSPSRGSWLLSLVALAALASTLQAWLGGSDSSAMLTQAAQDTAQQLRGTWLREYDEKGVRVRRVLALEPGGTFRESVRVVEPSGQVTEYRHEGTWLYDGTNLKRRYTSMNGEPPSRLNLPFATFEIAFDSANAFRGIDHVHGHQVAYRRIDADR
jgi:hypothetical protein